MMSFFKLLKIWKVRRWKNEKYLSNEGKKQAEKERKKKDIFPLYENGTELEGEKIKRKKKKKEKEKERKGKKR